MTTRWIDLRHKLLGDRRDQRRVLRAAGFADERSAAAWAREHALTVEPERELAAIRDVRRARPDLTLATARYIVRQARMHAA